MLIKWLILWEMWSINWLWIQPSFLDTNLYYIISLQREATAKLLLCTGTGKMRSVQDALLFLQVKCHASGLAWVGPYLSRSEIRCDQDRVGRDVIQTQIQTRTLTKIGFGLVPDPILGFRSGLWRRSWSWPWCGLALTLSTTQSRIQTLVRSWLRFRIRLRSESRSRHESPHNFFKSAYGTSAQGQYEDRCPKGRAPEGILDHAFLQLEFGAS